jgi:hypothetical protein
MVSHGSIIILTIFYLHYRYLRTDYHHLESPPCTATSMPRRKPASAKQRKADLQLKRAVKRGDIAAPPKEQPKRRPPGANERTAVPPVTGVGTKRLESHFLKMDKHWLEQARFVASTTPLIRPIPFERAVLDLNKISGVQGEHGATTLTAPKRPKWRYDQTKKEVERNEEGVFAKWTKEVDESVKRWQRQEITIFESQQESSNTVTEEGMSPPPPPLERSPTYFERNLEVWRQLLAIQSCLHSGSILTLLIQMESNRDLTNSSGSPRLSRADHSPA